MMKKKERKRTTRRRIERELDKIGDAKEKLALLSPGGAPENAIEISTASIAESTAKSLGCARCDGELGELEHEAVRAPTGSIVRRIRARCRKCGARREVWLRIALPS
jgi:hypothetical protein